jgi:hypothetical protein
MSLFNTIMAEVENSSELSQQSTNPEAPNVGDSAAPGWWIDDNTPGIGDRPDWLPSNFKSVSDIAKSYAELQKKLGTAPDAYDWEKGSNWFDPNYEPLQELAKVAKEKRVPQEFFDQMLESVGKYFDEFKVDYNEERTKLGEGAEDRLKVLNNWAKSNFSEDTFNALTSSMQTAESVKAIEEIRNKMLENNTKIPTGNEDNVAEQASLSEIQSELNENFAKYKTDAKYRKEMNNRLANAASKSDYVDKNY